MDKLFLGFALVSLAGNIWMALSWRRAVGKAVLTDVYAKLLVAQANINVTQRSVIARKEEHIRELEKAVVEHFSAPELVERLNGMFADPKSHREASTVPIVGKSAKSPKA